MLFRKTDFTDQQEYFSPHLLIGVSAICLIVVILASIVQYNGILEFAELKFRVWLPYSRPEISSKIVLVEVDNKTVSEEFLGPLPWPINIYSPFILTVNQAQPKAVSLFIWFNREWQGGFFLPGESLFVVRPYNMTEGQDKNDIVKVDSWCNIPSALADAEVKSFSHIPLSVEDGLR